MNQVLIMVITLSREDKISMMFCEPSVCEELQLISFLCLVNVNFEDKIFYKGVECNTRKFFLRVE